MISIPSRLAAVALSLAVAAVCLAGAGRADAQPTESDIYVAEGILAIEDKKYTEALAHFRRALEREPDHIEALYYSGVAHMRRDRPADALPFLEKAHKQSPTESSVAVQLGMAYFALNQFAKAEPLLEDVFDREPTLDSLGYFVGRIRQEKRDHQGALRAYRAGRTSDTTIAQLTAFYAGTALSALGLPTQAAAEIERAMRLQPASPLTGPAERLRDTITTTRARGSRFRADMRVGAYYDDNASTEPNRKREDGTVRVLRHPKQETTGELAALRLDYTWLRHGPWEGSVAYSFFTTYNNDLPGFNLIDHLASVGITRTTTVFDLPLQTGASYSYEYLTLDDDELIQRNGVSLFGTLIESSTHLTSGQARVDVKEFSEVRPTEREDFQDAINWLVGLVHVMRFSGGRHFVKAGYQFDVEDAQGSNFKYHGHRFLAGGQYTLPWWDIRLGYDFWLHYRDYLRRHSTFPDDADGRTKERTDNEFGNVLRVEVPLPQNFTLGADFQSTIVDSNMAVFSYRRNVFTISLSWQY